MLYEWMEGNRRSRFLLDGYSLEEFYDVRLIDRRKPNRRKNSAPGDAPGLSAWYCLYGSDAETKERSLEEKTFGLASSGADVECDGRRDESGFSLIV